MQLFTQRRLDLEVPLRRAWSKVRLLHGAEHENEAAAKTVSITKCTEAITSNYFWNYLAMLNVLSEVGNHIHSWFQSCPCHHGEALKSVKSRFGKCPNQGRLLPQLAAGALDRLASELFVKGHAEIVAKLRDLEPGQTMEILDDFELGRQHMLLHVALKGAYHQGLPLVIAGLAHPEHAMVVRCARRALALWAALTPELRAAAHPKSRRFLSDGPEYHRDATEALYAQGAGLVQNCDFFAMEADVYRLALAKVDEHRAESPHAIMVKQLHHAPHASASTLSLAARMPLWEWMVEEKPQRLQELALDMHKVYNADWAAFFRGS